MKRPKIVVIDDESIVRNVLRDTLQTKVSDQIGIELDVQTYERCPEDITEITDATLLILDQSLGEGNKTGNQIAQELKDSGAQGERIMISADVNGAISKMTGADNNGLLDRFSKDREANAIQNWQKSGAHELFPGGMFQKPLNPQELTGIILNLRKEGKINIPLSVGVVGLGKLGLGTVQELVKEHWVANIGAYTNFVKGSQEEYQKLLGSLDLPGEEREKIVTHGHLDGLVETNPDVIIIATGEFNTPYFKYAERTSLTQRLFQKGIQKIDPILEKIKELGCKSLLAIESNPNGHFIHYAMEKGIPTSQLTSFSPDTMRHVREVYETLKKNHPDLKEDEIELMVIGEHMKGGTPLYHEAKVKGELLTEFDPRFARRAFQRKKTNRARKKGLEVMQSSIRYGHDYRGVPRRVIEGLHDIAHFQPNSKSPIYAGTMSIPATFVYSSDNGSCFPRVHPTYNNLTEFTQDRYALREISADRKKIVKQVREWTKAKTK